MTPHIDSRRFYRSTLSIMLSALLMAVALLGGCSEPEPTPTPSPVPTAPPAMATPALVAAAALTPTGTATSPTATPVLTVTVTVTVTATGCPAPTGWVRYTVAEGDTLSSLEATSGASVTALMQANCLVDTTIYVGQTLYLPVAPPPTATPTPEPTRCGAPTGWVVYVVQPGDTLSVLASRVGASVEEIRLANCLPDDTIYAGRGLRLPQLPGGTDTNAGAPVAPVAVAERPTYTAPTPCPPFACVRAELQEPPLDIRPGSPGVGDLCSDGEQISIGVRAIDGATRALPAPIPVGNVLRLGACNVSANETITFSLTAQDGASAVLPTEIVTAVNPPVPAAIWEAGCDEVGREYTVSYLTSSSSMPVSRLFGLKSPRFASSYFTIQDNSGRYRVHFCYETPPAQPIALRLYHGTTIDNHVCRVTTYREGVTLTMTSATGGFVDLILPLPAGSGGCYVLRDITTVSKPNVVIEMPTTD